jgi:hypothetical protein
MSLTLTEFANRFYDSQYRDNFTPWAVSVLYQYLQENDLEDLMDDVTAICGEFSEGELSTLAGGLKPSKEDYTECLYDEEYEPIPDTEEFDGEAYRAALLKDLHYSATVICYKDSWENDGTPDITVLYSD